MCNYCVCEEDIGHLFSSYTPPLSSELRTVHSALQNLVVICVLVRPHTFRLSLCLRYCSPTKMLLLPSCRGSVQTETARISAIGAAVGQKHGNTYNCISRVLSVSMTKAACQDAESYRHKIAGVKNGSYQLQGCKVERNSQAPSMARRKRLLQRIV